MAYGSPNLVFAGQVSSRNSNAQVGHQTRDGFGRRYLENDSLCL